MTGSPILPVPWAVCVRIRAHTARAHVKPNFSISLLGDHTFGTVGG